MFKRIFLVMAMMLAFAAPMVAAAEETQDAPAAEVQNEPVKERITKYWLGSFEKYGDSSRVAQGHIQKVVSQEGTLSYRILVADYIPSYRGDMIPEAGKVDVWNQAAGAYETYEISVFSHDTNGYGTYYFTFSLPNEVIDLQRENLKSFELGDEKRKLVISFTAHNSVGHHVPFECKTDCSYAMEYGM